MLARTATQPLAASARRLACVPWLSVPALSRLTHSLAPTMACRKLHGRAFYESLGSPRYVLAPMVDQSEFAWRLLTRSFLPAELRASLLAYSPMMHAKLFAEGPKYRASHFRPRRGGGWSSGLAARDGDEARQLGGKREGEGEGEGEGEEEGEAHLDGHPCMDRPLFVQFCANEAEHFLEAARLVQPFCDAVDLNLGCPQSIAKRGHYGAFLQEDWDTIRALIRTLHERLDVPVTAKFRILETKERTVEYARMILDAGASIITVHGRVREQKGHNTGLADWEMIRHLRESLPPETVIFANGNVLQHADLTRCLEATGADGVMSAEGNLYDPSIFAAAPAPGDEGREYWRGRDGTGGYRADAVLRRYLDIIHEHVLGHSPPERAPLFIVSDVQTGEKRCREQCHEAEETGSPRATKKQKREQKREQKLEQKDTDPTPKPGAKKKEKTTDVNLVAMQAHCFHILRPLVAQHHDVRDALARCRAGDIAAYEDVLRLTESAVRRGLLAYAADPGVFEDAEKPPRATTAATTTAAAVGSEAAVRRCRRPWWVCQAHVRPLPCEALAKGSMQLSKKAARAKEARSA